ncbi:MAG: hypothetical protein ACLRM9_02195 [Collinsella aerofaciens]
MATADPKKKKKKRKKKESLEHKRNRILVALGIFGGAPSMSLAPSPPRSAPRATTTPALCCSSCRF